MFTNFFLRMLLGHLIGDFTFQPLQLALAKRAGWSGLLLHVSIVTITTGIIIWGAIPNWLTWTAILFIVHLGIDQFRTFVFTDNSNGKGVTLFLLDQLAHLISILIISWLATDSKPTSLQDLFISPLSNTNAYIFLLCVAVVAIWVIPILEVELTIAITTYKKPLGKGVEPIRRLDRIMGGLERLISLTLITLSMGLFIPLAFLPRFYWLLKENTSPNNIAIFSKSGTSFISTSLIGLLLWIAHIPNAVF